MRGGKPVFDFDNQAQSLRLAHRSPTNDMQYRRGARIESLFLVQFQFAGVDFSESRISLMMSSRCAPLWRSNRHIPAAGVERSGGAAVQHFRKTEDRVERRVGS